MKYNCQFVENEQHGMPGYCMELNILLICNKPSASQDANTIVDHISSFEHYSSHNIFIYSNIGDFSNRLDLTRFDAIIIHYTSSLVNNYYISPAAKKQLRDYSGLKILFIQDEYRQINKIISEMDFLKVDVLFTCFPESEMDNIYCRSKLPKLSKYTNLTGYIPERFTHLPPPPQTADRKIDVGYRSRKVPFWLGQLGFEKWNIVEQWHQHVGKNQGIIADISYHEKDRIYGDKWIEFLSSCKTSLGVESGASVMDFTGQLQTLVDFHQHTYPEDSFEKIHKMYLAEHEDQFKLNQISPRCFEAIALKTVLVLYEGEYSGILMPGKHYISLKKDYSNIQSVLKIIKDHNYLQYIADTAYQEIALNPEYSYSFFIKRVDQIVVQEFTERSKHKTDQPYSYEAYITDISPIISNTKEKSKITPLIRKILKSTSNLKLQIRNGISKYVHLNVARLCSLSFFRPIKYFFTRKVKVFNPILRRIKKIILPFMQQQ